jgi:ribonuclease P protein component
VTNGDFTHSGSVRYTLRKSEIVKRKADFHRILSGGRKFEGDMLSCFVLQSPCSATDREPGVKVGFAVRRLFKKAVDRNRLKRLMREAYRLHKQIITTRAGKASTQLLLVFLYSPKHRSLLPHPSAHAILGEMKTLLDAVARMEY